jgi:GH25 family lysozyme M1 (1,4-beta-N-acetylmuramidase)
MLGIDVFQQYNTVLDWQQVKADGVGAVWVKLTDGGGIATTPGDQYLYETKAAGLPVGGYHYAQSFPQPEVQAEVFAAELARLAATDVGPMLDLEEGAIRSPESFRERFWTHLRQRLPITPVLTYASESYWRTNLIDAPVVAGELIWDATFGPNDGTDHGTTLPKWDVHQYTSVGVLAGIAGKIDLDTITANVFTHPMDIGVPDMSLASTFEIDAAKGRAYASFEVGKNSVVIKELWVCAKALYGDIPDATLTFCDDNGNVVGTQGVTLKSNHRIGWSVPDAASDVTIEWDATKATGVIAPYLVWR